MTRLVLKRVASGIIVLWVISVAVFALFFIAPNDVAQKIAGRQATPLTVALVSKRLGLNRPILDQYGAFAWQLLHGNLGYSYYNSEPVLQPHRQPDRRHHLACPRRGRALAGRSASPPACWRRPTRAR